MRRRRRHAVVVGAGITGATAAHWLIHHGWDVTVYEKQPWVGGQLKTETFHGVSYEPHGPHIFHTNHVEAWDLVKLFLWRYEHRVLTTLPDGERHVTWPLQLGELKQLPEWPQIAAELDSRPGKPSAANFQDYAVELMGPTLYEWFCEGYTLKQWGAEPRTLSSRFAPKRLDLRTDDDVRMFRDRYQGYPRTGQWHEIVETLLELCDVRLGHELTVSNLPDADGYVITSALDDFLGSFRELPWRGVAGRMRYLLGVEFELWAPVVNDPRPDVPYTRRVETKQMIQPELRTISTIVVEELPGHSARHYPVDDVAGENRMWWRELAGEVKRLVPNSVIAGRLATYSYIDMDQAIMQGLNAARSLDRLE